jgi:hypothetical protein
MRLPEEAKKARYERRLKNAIERRTFREQIKSIKVDTFTKALVALIVVTALIDLQLSYVLAFLDKIQIAEDLSKQVCVTIIGTALVYMIRAYFDSKAEYGNGNNTSGSISKETSDLLNQHISSKIGSVLSGNDGSGTTVTTTTTTTSGSTSIVVEDPKLETLNSNDDAGSVG